MAMARKKAWDADVVYKLISITAALNHNNIDDDELYQLQLSELLVSVNSVKIPY